MIKFNSSPEPTIGVEIELQLVDKKNLNLKNISSKILAEVNEEFDEEKIWSSLNKACAKRPVSNRSLNKIILDIEAEIDKIGKSEISSKKIGQIIMSGLEKLDRVSYIRFASVYREFENIETFRKEIDTLLSEKNKK